MGIAQSTAIEVNFFLLESEYAHIKVPFSIFLSQFSVPYFFRFRQQWVRCQPMAINLAVVISNLSIQIAKNFGQFVQLSPSTPNLKFKIGINQGNIIEIWTGWGKWNGDQPGWGEFVMRCCEHSMALGSVERLCCDIRGMNYLLY